MKEHTVRNCDLARRLQIGEIPTPTEFHKRIMRQLVGRKQMIDENNDSWNLGFATAKGNVRSENQDYGAAFGYRGHQVLLIADGMGGLSHGSLASYLAVSVASQEILTNLQDSMSIAQLQELASRVMWSVSHQLSHIGDKLNVIITGLRTTLIIVIADATHVALAYIGDGAVYHYKRPDNCTAVLEAQKAIPGNLSLLAASLGPTPHGKPRSRILQRTGNDLIIAMTDGIADRIDTIEKNGSPPVFIEGLVSKASVHQGDLSSTVEEAIDELADLEDDLGYICDDNISLGCIGNQKSPSCNSEHTSGCEYNEDEQYVSQTHLLFPPHN